MPYARTMAFTTLVFFQLFNIFNARSSGTSAFSELFRNRWIWAAVALSAVLQVAVVYVPVLQTAFGTVPLNVTDWMICIATGSVVLWVNELAKLLNRSEKEKGTFYFFG
jgi:Ca2+-transporting ATPase